MCPECRDHLSCDFVQTRANCCGNILGIGSTHTYTHIHSLDTQSHSNDACFHLPTFGAAEAPACCLRFASAGTLFWSCLLLATSVHLGLTLIECQCCCSAGSVQTQDRLICLSCCDSLARHVCCRLRAFPRTLRWMSLPVL